MVMFSSEVVLNFVCLTCVFVYFLNITSTHSDVLKTEIKPFNFYLTLVIQSLPH